ncbi:hypothetical protein [Sporosarcina sp. FSL K6-3457]|uniref:hypothetical protein n=1 Tax=Sporosarcina sp. FSL K6-3457 TaxID=2978204 RepID=UPI0030FAD068
MKKKIWISFSILAVIIVGIYFSLKLNPPLEIGTLASSGDNKSVVVEIGNRGSQEVKIFNVLVNNNDIPMETKIQVSNALQGFIITDNFNDDKAKEYGFEDIDGVAIKTGSSSSSNLKKLDNGTASKSDVIYGISILHNNKINKVHIKYSHLGMTFEETVILN